MRKALIVGIDYYEHDDFHNLSGCVNDAVAIDTILSRHADGTVNFSSRVLTGPSEDEGISRRELKSALTELFSDDADVALFYFSGHGHIESTGGYICASDSTDGDELPLAQIVALANQSRAKNKVIILDSCYSGSAAENPSAPSSSDIQEGVTILTASAADQYSLEVPGGGSGVFTDLLVDALSGAAANLRGAITPGSVYAHIDQSLGPWQQRPVFKTNVKTFVSLRDAEPPISLLDLKALATLFPSPGYHFPLDPSYEPLRSAEDRADPAIPDPDPTHTNQFRILQNLVRVNLVQPVNAPHMWHAAMESQSCALTVLGQHYWKLVDAQLI